MRTQTEVKTAVAPGRSSDAPALAQLHAACFAQGWDARTIRQYVLESDCLVLMAHQIGVSTPVGLLICRAAGGEAEILTLAVSPECRRRGIGLALWHRAHRQLRVRGVARVVLEVGQDNRAALDLYRRLGFREVGHRNRYYRCANGGPRRDALIMARDLDPEVRP